MYLPRKFIRFISLTLISLQLLESLLTPIAYLPEPLEPFRTAVTAINTYNPIPKFIHILTSPFPKSVACTWVETNCGAGCADNKDLYSCGVTSIYVAPDTVGTNTASDIAAQTIAPQAVLDVISGEEMDQAQIYNDPSYTAAGCGNAAVGDDAVRSDDGCTYTCEGNGNWSLKSCPDGATSNYPPTGGLSDPLTGDETACEVAPESQACVLERIEEESQVACSNAAVDEEAVNAQDTCTYKCLGQNSSGEDQWELVECPDGATSLYGPYAGLSEPPPNGQNACDVDPNSSACQYLREQVGGDCDSAPFGETAVRSSDSCTYQCNGASEPWELVSCPDGATSDYPPTLGWDHPRYSEYGGGGGGSSDLPDPLDLTRDQCTQYRCTNPADPTTCTVLPTSPGFWCTNSQLCLPASSNVTCDQYEFYTSDPVDWNTANDAANAEHNCPAGTQWVNPDPERDKPGGCISQALADAYCPPPQVLWDGNCVVAPIRQGDTLTDAQEEYERAQAADDPTDVDCDNSTATCSGQACGTVATDYSHAQDADGNDLYINGVCTVVCEPSGSWRTVGCAGVEWQTRDPDTGELTGDNGYNQACLTQGVCTPNTCGNGDCDPGESYALCPNDCREGVTGGTGEEAQSTGDEDPNWLDLPVTHASFSSLSEAAETYCEPLHPDDPDGLSDCITDAILEGYDAATSRLADQVLDWCAEHDTSAPQEAFTDTNICTGLNEQNLAALDITDLQSIISLQNQLLDPSDLTATTSLVTGANNQDRVSPQIILDVARDNFTTQLGDFCQSHPTAPVCAEDIDPDTLNLDQIDLFQQQITLNDTFFDACVSTGISDGQAAPIARVDCTSLLSTYTPEEQQDYIRNFNTRIQEQIVTAYRDYCQSTGNPQATSQCLVDIPNLSYEEMAATVNRVTAFEQSVQERELATTYATIYCEANPIRYIHPDDCADALVSANNLDYLANLATPFIRQEVVDLATTLNCSPGSPSSLNNPTAYQDCTRETRDRYSDYSLDQLTREYNQLNATQTIRLLACYTSDPSSLCSLQPIDQLADNIICQQDFSCQSRLAALNLSPEDLLDLYQDLETACTYATNRQDCLAESALLSSTQLQAQVNQARQQLNQEAAAANQTLYQIYLQELASQYQGSLTPEATAAIETEARRRLEADQRLALQPQPELIFTVTCTNETHTASSLEEATTILDSDGSCYKMESNQAEIEEYTQIVKTFNLNWEFASVINSELLQRQYRDLGMVITPDTTLADFTSIRDSYSSGQGSIQNNIVVNLDLVDNATAVALIYQINFTDPNFRSSAAFQELTQQFPTIARDVANHWSDNSRTIIEEARRYTSTTYTNIQSQSDLAQEIIDLCTRPNGSRRDTPACNAAFTPLQPYQLGSSGVNFTALQSQCLIHPLGSDLCNRYTEPIIATMPQNPLAITAWESQNDDRTYNLLCTRPDGQPRNTPFCNQTNLSADGRIVANQTARFSQVGDDWCTGFRVNGLLGTGFLRNPLCNQYYQAVGITTQQRHNQICDDPGTSLTSFCQDATVDANGRLIYASTGQDFCNTRGQQGGPTANSEDNYRCSYVYQTGGNLNQDLDPNNPTFELWQTGRDERLAAVANLRQQGGNEIQVALLNLAYTGLQMFTHPSFFASLGGSQIGVANQYSYDAQALMYQRDYLRCNGDIACMDALGTASQIAVANENRIKGINLGITAALAVTSLAGVGALSSLATRSTVAAALTQPVFPGIQLLRFYQPVDIILTTASTALNFALVDMPQEYTVAALNDLSQQNPDNDQYQQLADAAQQELDQARITFIAQNFVMDFVTSFGAAAARSLLATSFGRIAIPDLELAIGYSRLQRSLVDVNVDLDGPAAAARLSNLVDEGSPNITLRSPDGSTARISLDPNTGTRTIEFNGTRIVIDSSGTIISGAAEVSLIRIQGSTRSITLGDITYTSLIDSSVTTQAIDLFTGNLRPSDIFNPDGLAARLAAKPVDIGGGNSATIADLRTRATAAAAQPETPPTQFPEGYAQIIGPDGQQVLARSQAGETPGDFQTRVSPDLANKNGLTIKIGNEDPLAFTPSTPADTTAALPGHPAAQEPPPPEKAVTPQRVAEQAAPPTRAPPPKSSLATRSGDEIAIANHRFSTPADPDQPRALIAIRDPEARTWTATDFAISGNTPEQVQAHLAQQLAQKNLQPGQLIVVEFPDGQSYRWTVTDVGAEDGSVNRTLHRVITDPWSLADGRPRPQSAVIQFLDTLRSRLNPFNYRRQLADLFVINLRQGKYTIVDVGGQPIYSIAEGKSFTHQDVLAARMMNQDIAAQLVEVSGFPSLRFEQVTAYPEVLAVLNQEGQVLLTLRTGGGKDTAVTPIVTKMNITRGQNVAQLQPDDLFQGSIDFIANKLRDFYATDIFVARDIVNASGQPTGRRAFFDLDGNLVDPAIVAARLRQSGTNRPGAIIVTDYSTAAYSHNDVVNLRQGNLDAIADVEFARTWQVLFDGNTFATGNEIGQVLSGRWSTGLGKIPIGDLPSSSRLAYGLTGTADQPVPRLLYDIFTETEAFAAVTAARTRKLTLTRTSTGELRALQPLQAAEIIRDVLRATRTRLANQPDFAGSFIDTQIAALLDEPDPLTLIRRFDGLRQIPSTDPMTQQFQGFANAYNAAVYSRLDIIAKIPGNDFQIDSGEIRLASSKAVTGTEYTDVMQVWALQTEGRLQLGFDPPSQSDLFNLTVSDRSVITDIPELMRNFKGGFMAMDATDGIPAARLGLRNSAKAAPLHPPRAVHVAPTPEATTAKLAQDSIIEWNEGRQVFVVNQNARTQSLDQNTSNLLKDIAGQLQPGDRFALALMSGDGVNSLRVYEVTEDGNFRLLSPETTYTNTTDLYSAGQNLDLEFDNFRGILAMSEDRTRGINYKPENAFAPDINHIKALDEYGNSTGDGTRQTAGRLRTDPGVDPEYELYWTIRDPSVRAKYEGLDQPARSRLAHQDILANQRAVESLLRFERQLADLRQTTTNIISQLESSPQADQPGFRDFLSRFRADITENEFAFRSTPVEENRLQVLYREYVTTRQRITSLIEQARLFGIDSNTLSQLNSTHLSPNEISLAQLEAIAAGRTTLTDLPPDSLEAKLVQYAATKEEGQSLLADTYNSGSPGDIVAVARDIVAFQARRITTQPETLVELLQATPNQLITLAFRSTLDPVQLVRLLSQYALTSLAPWAPLQEYVANLVTNFNPTSTVANQVLNQLAQTLETTNPNLALALQAVAAVTPQPVPTPTPAQLEAIQDQVQVLLDDINSNPTLADQLAANTQAVLTGFASLPDDVTTEELAQVQAVLNRIYQAIDEATAVTAPPSTSEQSVDLEPVQRPAPAPVAQTITILDQQVTVAPDDTVTLTYTLNNRTTQTITFLVNDNLAQNIENLIRNQPELATAILSVNAPNQPAETLTWDQRSLALIRYADLYHEVTSLNDLFPQNQQQAIPFTPEDLVDPNLTTDDIAEFTAALAAIRTSLESTLDQLTAAPQITPETQPNSTVSQLLATGQYTQTGNYLIHQGVVSRGGFADIRFGWEIDPDGNLSRPVAIKSANNKPEAQQYLDLEADRLTQLLGTPGIIELYAIIETDQGRSLVLEWLGEADTADTSGQAPQPYPTLETWLADASPTPEQVLGILRTLATTIDAIHQQGIIHRDIKPANIIRRPDGTPVLIDFAAPEEVTPQGVFSSLGYTSPEASYGTINPSASDDLYSFAVTAYQLLAGQLPLLDENGQPNPFAGILYQDVDQIQLPEGTNGTAFNAVFTRAFFHTGYPSDLTSGFSAQRRYSTAQAFVRDLETIISTTAPIITELQATLSDPNLNPDQLRSLLTSIDQDLANPRYQNRGTQISLLHLRQQAETRFEQQVLDQNTIYFRHNTLPPQLTARLQVESTGPVTTDRGPGHSFRENLYDTQTGQLVGFRIRQIIQQQPNGETILHRDQINITRQFQNQGIATQILNREEQVARDDLGMNAITFIAASAGAYAWTQPPGVELDTAADGRTIDQFKQYLHEKVNELELTTDQHTTLHQEIDHAQTITDLANIGKDSGINYPIYRYSQFGSGPDADLYRFEPTFAASTGQPVTDLAVGNALFLADPKLSWNGIIRLQPTTADADRTAALTEYAQTSANAGIILSAIRTIDQTLPASVFGTMIADLETRINADLDTLTPEEIRAHARQLQTTLDQIQGAITAVNLLTPTLSQLTGITQTISDLTATINALQATVELLQATPPTPPSTPITPPPPSGPTAIIPFTAIDTALATTSQPVDLATFYVLLRAIAAIIEGLPQPVREALLAAGSQLRASQLGTTTYIDIIAQHLADLFTAADADTALATNQELARILFETISYILQRYALPGTTPDQLEDIVDGEVIVLELESGQVPLLPAPTPMRIITPQEQALESQRNYARFAQATIIMPAIVNQLLQQQAITDFLAKVISTPEETTVTTQTPIDIFLQETAQAVRAIRDGSLSQARNNLDTWIDSVTYAVGDTLATFMANNRTQLEQELANTGLDRATAVQQLGLTDQEYDRTLLRPLARSARNLAHKRQLAQVQADQQAALARQQAAQDRQQAIADFTTAQQELNALFANIPQDERELIGTQIPTLEPNIPLRNFDTLLSLAAADLDNLSLEAIQNYTTALATTIQNTIPLRIPQPNDIITGANNRQYTLQSKLGEGGSAEVWLAQYIDTDGPHSVSIKIARPTIQEGLRLERHQSLDREAQTLRSLSGQQHIPQLIEAIPADSNPYQQPLLISATNPNYINARRLVQQQSTDSQRLIQLAVNIAKISRNLAQQGIIHRDIKPNNILVAKNPDGTIDWNDYQLIDFGVSTSSQEDLLFATRYYAAPETITNPESQEVYALTATLIRLLAVKDPTQGSTPHPNEINPALFAQYPGLRQLITKGLTNNPQAAYSSLSAFAEDLQTIATATSPQDTVATAQELYQFTPKNLVTTIHTAVSRLLSPINQLILTISKQFSRSQNTSQFSSHLVDQPSQSGQQAGELSVNTTIPAADQTMLTELAPFSISSQLHPKNPAEPITLDDAIVHNLRVLMNTRDQLNSSGQPNYHHRNTYTFIVLRGGQYKLYQIEFPANEQAVDNLPTIIANLINNPEEGTTLSQDTIDTLASLARQSQYRIGMRLSDLHPQLSPLDQLDDIYSQADGTSLPPKNDPTFATFGNIARTHTRLTTITGQNAVIIDQKFAHAWAAGQPAYTQHQQLLGLLGNQVDLSPRPSTTTSTSFEVTVSQEQINVFKEELRQALRSKTNLFTSTEVDQAVTDDLVIQLLALQHLGGQVSHQIEAVNSTSDNFAPAPIINLTHITDTSTLASAIRLILDERQRTQRGRGLVAQLATLTDHRGRTFLTFLGNFLLPAQSLALHPTLLYSRINQPPGQARSIFSTSSNDIHNHGVAVGAIKHLDAEGKSAGYTLTIDIGDQAPATLRDDAATLAQALSDGTAAHALASTPLFNSLNPELAARFTQTIAQKYAVSQDTADTVVSDMFTQGGFAAIEAEERRRRSQPGFSPEQQLIFTHGLEATAYRYSYGGIDYVIKQVNRGAGNSRAYARGQLDGQTILEQNGFTNFAPVRIVEHNGESYIVQRYVSGQQASLIRPQEYPLFLDTNTWVGDPRGNFIRTSEGLVAIDFSDAHLMTPEERSILITGQRPPPVAQTPAETSDTEILTQLQPQPPPRSRAIFELLVPEGKRSPSRIYLALLAYGIGLADILSTIIFVNGLGTEQEGNPLARYLFEQGPTGFILTTVFKISILTISMGFAKLAGIATNNINVEKYIVRAFSSVAAIPLLVNSVAMLYSVNLISPVTHAILYYPLLLISIGLTIVTYVSGIANLTSTTVVNELNQILEAIKPHLSQVDPNQDTDQASILRSLATILDPSQNVYGQKATPEAIAFLTDITSNPTSFTQKLDTGQITALLKNTQLQTALQDLANLTPETAPQTLEETNPKQPAPVTEAPAPTPIWTRALDWLAQNIPFDIQTTAPLSEPLAPTYPVAGKTIIVNAQDQSFTVTSRIQLNRLSRFLRRSDTVSTTLTRRPRETSAQFANRITKTVNNHVSTPNVISTTAGQTQWSGRHIVLNSDLPNPNRLWSALERAARKSATNTITIVTPNQPPINVAISRDGPRSTFTHLITDELANILSLRPTTPHNPSYRPIVTAIIRLFAPRLIQYNHNVLGKTFYLQRPNGAFLPHLYAHRQQAFGRLASEENVSVEIKGTQITRTTQQITAATNRYNFARQFITSASNTLATVIGIGLATSLAINIAWAQTINALRDNQGQHVWETQVSETTDQTATETVAPATLTPTETTAPPATPPTMAERMAAHMQQAQTPLEAVVNSPILVEWRTAHRTQLVETARTDPNHWLNQVIDVNNPDQVNHYIQDPTVRLLILGSDDRPGGTVGIEQSRSDVTLLLTLSPDGATMTFLQRDMRIPESELDFPDHPQGWDQHLNVALMQSSTFTDTETGATITTTTPQDQATEVFTRLTETPIDSVFIMGFDGFTQIVDRLSGGEFVIFLSEPIHSHSAEVSIDMEAGWHTIDAQTALDLSRARAGSSDFSRQLNQALVLFFLAQDVITEANITQASEFIQSQDALPQDQQVIRRSAPTTVNIDGTPTQLTLEAVLIDVLNYYISNYVDNPAQLFQDPNLTIGRTIREEEYLDEGGQRIPGVTVEDLPVLDNSTMQPNDDFDASIQNAARWNSQPTTAPNQPPQPPAQSQTAPSSPQQASTVPIITSGSRVLVIGDSQIDPQNGNYAQALFQAAGMTDPNQVVALTFWGISPQDLTQWLDQRLDNESTSTGPTQVVNGNNQQTQVNNIDLAQLDQIIIQVGTDTVRSGADVSTALQSIEDVVTGHPNLSFIILPVPPTSDPTQQPAVDAFNAGLAQIANANPNASFIPSTAQPSLQVDGYHVTSDYGQSIAQILIQAEQPPLGSSLPGNLIFALGSVVSGLTTRISNFFNRLLRRPSAPTRTTTRFIVPGPAAPPLTFREIATTLRQDWNQSLTLRGLVIFTAATLGIVSAIPIIQNLPDILEFVTNLPVISTLILGLGLIPLATTRSPSLPDDFVPQDQPTITTEAELRTILESTGDDVDYKLQPPGGGETISGKVGNLRADLSPLTRLTTQGPPTTAQTIAALTLVIGNQSYTLDLSTLPHPTQVTSSTTNRWRSAALSHYETQVQVIEATADVLWENLQPNAISANNVAHTLQQLSTTPELSTTTRAPQIFSLLAQYLAQNRLTLENYYRINQLEPKQQAGTITPEEATELDNLLTLTSQFAEDEDVNFSLMASALQSLLWAQRELINTDIHTTLVYFSNTAPGAQPSFGQLLASLDLLVQIGTKPHAFAQSLEAIDVAFASYALAPQPTSIDQIVNDLYLHIANVPHFSFNKKVVVYILLKYLDLTYSPTYPQNSLDALTQMALDLTDPQINSLIYNDQSELIGSQRLKGLMSVLLKSDLSGFQLDTPIDIPTALVNISNTAINLNTALRSKSAQLLDPSQQALPSSLPDYIPINQLGAGGLVSDATNPLGTLVTLAPNAAKLASAANINLSPFSPNLGFLPFGSEVFDLLFRFPPIRWLMQGLDLIFGTTEPTQTTPNPNNLLSI